MPAKHALKICLLLCLLVGSLLACNVAVPNISISGTQVITPPGVTGTQLPLGQWKQAKPGVEVQYANWKAPSGHQDTVIITRFNLHQVHLYVGYQPNNPLTLSDWMKQTGATAIINGGYFDTNNQATGLIVSNGQASGTSYTDQGGMLSVNTQGAVAITSLIQHPFDGDTNQLEQATQCAPMLMVNGKETQFDDNAAQRRRTVVAMDKDGNLLFIVSPSDAFTVTDMADLLASHTELNIQTALNLDGGSSTGIYLNGGNTKVALDPISSLPIVVYVK
ncbi:MAG TPA: phosphodiester glycosidase family protein [Dictyobacter sp.]|jgi:uncharacterized protein YigE (DUF2233 family)|nr:phosphodiester glycosidase family protein [Dictyobacter sp.]